MARTILERVLLPVANAEDARTTCASALPRIAAAGGSVICVHVVEKGGGAPDPVSPTQQEGRAEEIFEVVTGECEAAGVPCETRLRYGTDVVETIFETAREEDASAIGFVPRESGRLADLLSGSPSRALISGTDRPVVAFPSE